METGERALGVVKVRRSGKFYVATAAKWPGCCGGGSTEAIAVEELRAAVRESQEYKEVNDGES